MFQAKWHAVLEVRLIRFTHSEVARIRIERPDLEARLAELDG